MSFIYRSHNSLFFNNNEEKKIDESYSLLNYPYDGQQEDEQFSWVEPPNSDSCPAILLDRFDSHHYSFVNGVKIENVTYRSNNDYGQILVGTEVVSSPTRVYPLIVEQFEPSCFSRKKKRIKNRSKIPRPKELHYVTGWDYLPINEDIEIINIKEPRKNKHSLNIKSVKKIRYLKATKRALKPHSGEDPPGITTPRSDYEGLLDSLSELNLPCNSSDNDSIMMHVENVAILGFQLVKAVDWSDYLIAFTVYLKLYTKRSVVQLIFKLMNDSIDDKGSIDPHSFDTHDILDKWELFKNHEMFRRLSFLMTAAMSLSVCNINNIEWSPFGFKLVSLEAVKEQVKSIDIIDALIKTFVWMSETGQCCIKEKSLAPILFSDQRVRTFHKRCDEVIAYSASALAGNHSDINSYEKDLQDVLKQISQMKALKPNTSIGLWLQKKYSDIVQIQECLVAKHKNTTMRDQPFGISISGPSSVGKTTIAKITMKVSLKAMGYTADPDRILTIDQDDKYDSTYTSDIEGLFIDDVANTKSKFVEKAPSSLLIKFFNNVAAQAIKAELNEKGVVFLNFKVGIVTTNVKDLEARIYSNEPSAVLRRFLHVSVKVKNKYLKAQTTMLNVEHEDFRTGELTVDAWRLTIEEYTVLGHVGEFHILKHRFNNGTTLRCENISLKQYLLVIAELSTRHGLRQKILLNRAKKFDEMKCCKCCFLPLCIECECPQSFENFEKLAIDVVKSTLWKYWQNYTKPFKLINSLLGFSPLNKCSTLYLSSELTKHIDYVIDSKIVPYIPNFIYNNSFCQSIFRYHASISSNYDFSYLRRIGAFLALTSIPLLCYKPRRDLGGLTLMISGLTFYSGCCTTKTRVDLMMSRYLERRDALSCESKKIRDGKFSKGATIGIVLSLIIVALKMWNKQRISQLHSTNDYVYVNENSLSDPTQFDKKTPWHGFTTEMFGLKTFTNPICQTSNHSDVVKTLKRSVFWAEFIRSNDTSTSCNIWFPRKSVALLPKHVFYVNADMSKAPQPFLNVKVSRSSNPGGRFNFIAEYGNCYKFPNHDLVAVFVPNCPDLPDMEKWLPLAKPQGTCLSHVFARNSDLTWSSDNIRCSMTITGHSDLQFWGGTYFSDFPKAGRCMGPIVSTSKEPHILGFHIGGDVINRKGVFQTLLLSDYKLAIESFDKRDDTILSAHGCDLPLEQYGIPLLESCKVNDKAIFISDMTSNELLDIKGSTRLRAQQKSLVEESILSPLVAEHFNVPNIWDKPKMIPNWQQYNRALDKIVHPSKMFLPSHVERARKDWIKPLIICMKKSTEVFRPLTLRQNIMGIDGKRFIDAIPMSTSMGFPIFGKKDVYFDEITDNEGLNRIPKESVLFEMERMTNCWKNNERSYPVFCANLKDEPTKLSKTKVRVFQASPVAFGLSIRKYFLPIARFLSVHPLISESAVGINAASRDWEVLMGHAKKYSNKDKMLAWDYSDFDIRMTSQLTRAAISSLIELAVIAGYCTEDIKIMKAMVVDLCHPTIDFNGTLLIAYALNPSGNSLTVVVNGIVGCLYVRMAFFALFENVLNMRTCISMMTYGDDMIGSILPTYESFNFEYFRDYMAKHDIIVTLPDKSKNTTLFLDISKCDFLKRKSVFIEKLGVSVGAIDENSIYKSLHSNLRSKVATKEEVAISCVQTALHEWFFHGETIYENRRGKLETICDIMKLPVPAAKYTFDERVTMWHEQY